MDTVAADSAAVADSISETGFWAVDSLFPDSTPYTSALGLEDSLSAELLFARDLDARLTLVRDLVALRLALAEEPSAVQLLLRHADALEDERLELVRDAAARMSAEEIARLTVVPSSDLKSRAALRTELAVLLAQTGRRREADSVARQVVDGDPDDVDRDRARRVLNGEVLASPNLFRIGVILPRTGRLARVGDALLEGIRIALKEQQAGGAGTGLVELIVVDDSSSSDGAVRAIRRLEEQGVSAILGPVRSDALATAARRRSYPGLLLMSPTATEAPLTGPKAYTLWSRERRQGDVASAIGEWMTAVYGARRLAVLYPQTTGSDERLGAFEISVVAAGGEVVAARAYEPDSTSFGTEILQLAASEPDAVLVLTTAPRMVLQLGPQLAFYGLRSVLLAGGEFWSDPEAVRRLQPEFANYRVAATFVDRSSAESAWSQFKTLYENTYRKALPNNMFAGLGYDAMTLILGALPEDGSDRPGALSRRLESRGSIAGVTGQLRLERWDGLFSREVMIRMLMNRQLVEPDLEGIDARLTELREMEEIGEELRRDRAAGQRR
ncbi:MAG: ABC transporter substrate-binding protein [Gemmatimonadota bacterium]